MSELFSILRLCLLFHSELTSKQSQPHLKALKREDNHIFNRKFKHLDQTKMSFGGQGAQGVDPALAQFIQNETEKQKLQVIN